MKKKWLLPLMVMMSLAITFPVQAAPKVGEVLGHIVNEQADPKITGTGRLMEAYRTGIVGQCTWYARGRFKEVHGIELPYLGNAKNWITAEEKCAEVEVITDIRDILEQTIAVYAPELTVNWLAMYVSSNMWNEMPKVIPNTSIIPMPMGNMILSKTNIPKAVMVQSSRKASKLLRERSN